MEHRYFQVSLSVRYGSVLFPFDTVSYAKSMAKAGFILPDSMDTAQLEGQADISGAVARKGDVGLRIDVGRQVLAIDGTDPAVVLSEMKKAEEILQDEHGVESSRYAYFYELNCRLAVKACRNPLDCWLGHFSGTSLLSRMTEVIGEDASLFGIRVGRRGQDPNQPDWFGIRIEPRVRSATTEHFVEVVYRKGNRDDVFNFVERLDGTVERLVRLVEGA